jgi:hypothetical protein
MGILMEYSGLLWRKMKDNDERERGKEKEKVLQRERKKRRYFLTLGSFI